MPGSTNAAVTFDLWQTLIFEKRGSASSNLRRRLRSEYLADVLAELGVTIDQEVIDRELLELSGEITAGHDRGRDSRFVVWIERWIDRLDPGLADRIGPEGLNRVGRAIDRAFVDSPPHLLEGSLEILDALATRGLKTALISNTALTSPDAYREWFDQIDLLERLDQISLSNDLAVAKPTREIFERTLAALDVPPERTLHVGDNMHTDVAGAEAVGTSTVFVRGRTETQVPTDASPDYTVDSILELEPVVDKWLETLGG
ncbi:MAG: HAD family hydrolase [Dehalococcoidia bacterium]|nr:HAD family hydrolase [Dehalococcoidia bacterium]